MLFSKTKIAGLLVIVLFALMACKSNSPTQIPTVMPLPIEAKASVEPIVNECLVCHTDKQMLIDTAKPEEVVVKESSGTG